MPLLVKHQLPEMLAQRIYGLALGYEDLNDHEQLRSDPLLGVLSGGHSGWRRDIRTSQAGGPELGNKRDAEDRLRAPAESTPDYAAVHSERDRQFRSAGRLRLPDPGGVHDAGEHGHPGSVGTCTIGATQAGDATYAAARPVDRSFQVREPKLLPR